jgi:hypothetical protein
LAGVARGGSSNAADLSAMKHVLRLRDVISHPTVTAPLRPLTDSEVSELALRLRGLDDDAAADRTTPTAEGSNPQGPARVEPVPARS